jgi:hypothetical protein
VIGIVLTSASTIYSQATEDQRKDAEMQRNAKTWRFLASLPCRQLQSSAKAKLMSDAAVSQQAATRIRYLIVAAATLMSFLLYLDRFCVSFAIDYIRQDLGMTQGQAKWFLSAFFWSYALGQVPAGWLSDRFGARIMLVIYILTWSFFTGLIGAGRCLSDGRVDCRPLDADDRARLRQRHRC